MAGKSETRAELLAARRARPATEIATARAAVTRVVLAAAVERQWQTVASYVPLRTEPGSTDLLDGLVAAGVRTLVPVLLGDNDLDWVVWPYAPISQRLGRDAIGSAGAVLVPALAVASDGTRLGRGGGSYDRALTRVSESAVIAALVFSDEIRPELPHDPWDVPVHAVVTPDGWRWLGDAG